MTKLLAPRCERLLAIDGSLGALEGARREVASAANVTVEHAVLPGDLPAGPFDLIVACEILYYFTANDLDRVLDELAGALELGGDLVVAHWRASDMSYGYDGFNVHDNLRRRPGLASFVRHEDANFVLDVLRRAPSEADREA
jgi:hypothetical protein